MKARVGMEPTHKVLSVIWPNHRPAGPKRSKQVPATLSATLVTAKATGRYPFDPQVLSSLCQTRRHLQGPVPDAVQARFVPISPVRLGTRFVIGPPATLVLLSPRAKDCLEFFFISVDSRLNVDHVRGSEHRCLPAFL
jgi:hypothetical protein